MSQLREGPAPTISVKKETPTPINSRVSPRLKASCFFFCSSRSFLYSVASIAFLSAVW